MAPIRQLVYVSKAARPLSAREVQALAEVARENNRRMDVSGALLFVDNTFMQILEGDSDVLESLLETIRRDDRHRDLRVLSDSRHARRYFEGWSMGLVNPQDEARAQAREDLEASITPPGDGKAEAASVLVSPIFTMLQTLYQADTAGRGESDSRV
jgi:hypothetical protein